MYHRRVANSTVVYLKYPTCVQTRTKGVVRVVPLSHPLETTGHYTWLSVSWASDDFYVTSDQSQLYLFLEKKVKQKLELIYQKCSTRIQNEVIAVQRCKTETRKIKNNNRTWQSTPKRGVNIQTGQSREKDKHSTRNSLTYSSRVYTPGSQVEEKKENCRAAMWYLGKEWWWKIAKGATKTQQRLCRPVVSRREVLRVLWHKLSGAKQQ